MSQTTQLPDWQWEEWCRQFDIVFRDVQTMFHTRHIWKNLIEMLEQNPALHDTTVIKNWIIRSYVTTQCSAIRRLNDKRAKTISLRRCLGALRSAPTLVTRSRYEDLARVGTAARGTEDLLERVVGGYDEFADTSRDQLDIERLAKDLAKLDNASVSVKTYADKRIAHTDHDADLTPLLTFGDLDGAVDAVGELAHKYYRLGHPGQSFAWITPTVEPRWLAAFQDPWWTPHFRAIREESLG